MISFYFIAKYHKKFKVKQSLPYLFYRYFFQDYLLFLIRWIPGILGIAIRYFIFKLVFKKIGKNVTIQEGVYIAYPQGLIIGNNSAIGYCR